MKAEEGTNFLNDFAKKKKNFHIYITKKINKNHTLQYSISTVCTFYNIN